MRARVRVTVRGRVRARVRVSERVGAVAVVEHPRRLGVGARLAADQPRLG